MKPVDERHDHWWTRKSDLSISALCGYGRHGHEGSGLKRVCAGRNCKCECHNG